MNMNSWIVVSLMIWPSVGLSEPKTTSSPKPELNIATDELTKLRSLQTAASDRKSLSVEFDQEFYSALTKVTRKSKGTLDYLAPVSFRWEVQSPRKEIYVNNEKEFWKFQESTRHAQKLPSGALELDFIDLALRFTSLEKKYKLSSSKELKTGEKEFSIELVPLKEENQKRILLALSETTKTVTQMKIFYKNGNTTLISFRKPVFDSKPASRFVFEPPKGTAVDKL